METRAEMSFKHLLLSKESQVLFPVLLKATQAQTKPRHLTVNFRPHFHYLNRTDEHGESPKTMNIRGVRSGADWQMYAHPAFNSHPWVDQTIHFR